MNAELRFQAGSAESEVFLTATNDTGNTTTFDATPDHGGKGLAASPLEVLLQATAACSVMDVLSILRKKRKTVTGLRVVMEGDRADEHPRRFVAMRFRFILDSPDAALADLERAVELSQTTYCSAMAMARRSGCDLSFVCELGK
jgi:putative redox protein